MNRIFFTSDTHFGHANIIKYCDRPFLCDDERQRLARDGTLRISEDAVARMDAALIDGINSLVGERDVLWHLGDWAMAGKSGYQDSCRRYRDRIVCRTVNIVWGNHDRRSIRDLFNEAHEQVELSLEGQRIVLNHYAMAVWNRSHRGSWQFYGHSHGGAEAWMDAHLPGRRSMDVGVDHAFAVLGTFRPWSFEELQARLSSQRGCAIDHHGARGERRDEG
ncbi:MAG: metallophosphoesterase family protein [Gemmataceae bacterium]|nr:metallophosphoesterase family protein [Gemmataceae bacterium]